MMVFSTACGAMISEQAAIFPVLMTEDVLTCIDPTIN
jgi:hypothetical protein